MKQTLMLTVVASLACAPALRAGAVTDWSLIAQNSIVVVGKKFPGEAAVYMGIVHAAIYDAAVAVSGGYHPYRVSAGRSPRRFAGRGRRYGGAPRAGRPLPRPAGRSRRRPMPRAWPAFRRASPKTDGIAAGEQVGAGFLDLPAIDGLNDTVPYVQPPPGPGVYEPTASRAAARNEASPGRAAGPGSGFPVPARWPLAARQPGVRGRPQAGEEAGPPGQHGPDGGTDAHGPLLDRPRHPAVESQPGPPGRSSAAWARCRRPACWPWRTSRDPTR